MQNYPDYICKIIKIFPHKSIILIFVIFYCRMNNIVLTLSWQMSLTYRNESIDLQSK